MQIRIVEGEFADEACVNFYRTLLDIYRRGALIPYDSGLCTRVDRGTSEARLQPRGSTPGLSEESGDK